MRFIALTFSFCCAVAIGASAADRYALWIEPEFPFFSTSLDLRTIQPGAKPFHVVPRGLVLNLGHDYWACFDTELLRVAAVWRGRGVTPDGLGPLTYQDTHLKTIGGQEKLPKPDGDIFLVNGVYPGWQTDAEVSLIDPRAPETSAEEPGRGPLAADSRFQAVRLGAGGVVLEYTVFGAAVEEWMTASETAVTRNFRIGPSAQPLKLVHAQSGGNAGSMHIPARAAAIEIALEMSEGNKTRAADMAPKPVPKATRWPQIVTTHAVLSTTKDAYVMDDIPLPMDNPWRRNVRLSDIAFLPDGTAFASAFDGDIWMIRGLGEKLGEVQWRRFASGLAEPMSLVVRGGETRVGARECGGRRAHLQKHGLHGLPFRRRCETAEDRPELAWDFRNEARDCQSAERERR